MIVKIDTGGTRMARVSTSCSSAMGPLSPFINWSCLPNSRSWPTLQRKAPSRYIRMTNPDFLVEQVGHNLGIGNRRHQTPRSRRCIHGYCGHRMLISRRLQYHYPSFSPFGEIEFQIRLRKFANFLRHNEL